MAWTCELQVTSKSSLVQCPDASSSHAEAEYETKRSLGWFFSQETCWPLAMIRCFCKTKWWDVSAFLALYRYFFFPPLLCPVLFLKLCEVLAFMTFCSEESAVKLCAARKSISLSLLLSCCLTVLILKVTMNSHFPLVLFSVLLGIFFF